MASSQVRKKKKKPSAVKNKSEVQTQNKAYFKYLINLLQITIEACQQLATSCAKYYWESSYREVSFLTEKAWVSHLSPQTTLVCLKHFTLN